VATVLTNLLWKSTGTKVIDTNILLDWLLDRDRARTVIIDRFFAKAKDIHIPDLAFAELVFALEKYYELPRDIVSQNLNKVLDEQLFNCNRSLFRRVLTDYVERPALSFIDCCLVHYADAQHVLPLWTFDKKLISQSSGKARLLT
jgi:predicted nucleic-acid-binding protein